MDFSGKVVIVTGSGRGIGRGLVHWFAERNAKTVIVDVEETLGLDTCQEVQKLNPETLFVKADTSSLESVQECVQKVLKRFGKIDVLINNAAISRGDSFLDTSFEKWKQTIDINLTGVFIMSQCVAKSMIRQSISGRIVNIASVNSFTAEKNACPYVASKGGVNALTKSMAVDLAPYNIIVNAIAPGPIITEYNQEYFESEPMKTGIKMGVPIGRPGYPEDIAVTAGFLASEECKYIQGSTVVVDGGYTAYARFN